MDYRPAVENTSPEMKILRSMYSDHPDDMTSAFGVIPDKYVTHHGGDAPAANLTKYQGMCIVYNDKLPSHRDLVRV